MFGSLKHSLKPSVMSVFSATNLMNIWSALRETVVSKFVNPKCEIRFTLVCLEASSCSEATRVTLDQKDEDSGDLMWNPEQALWFGTAD